jgi:cation:H+ antiporter
MAKSMFASLSLPILLLLFAGAAAFVWVAGIRLSDTTDVLSSRLGLGQELGGLLLLAIVTNLPEIAITASAALSKELGLAVGNILGGIAIQTVVLVLLDAFGMRGSEALTYKAASLSLVLEGTLVIAVLTVAVMGSQLPTSLIFWRVEPGGLLIAALWIAGIWLIFKARAGLPWREEGIAPGGQNEPRGHSKAKKEQKMASKGVGTGRVVAVFAVAAVVTLGGGVLLEQSGEAIAKDVGMSGVLFGSTFLAAATALPEVSTGITSVRMGDYQLAVSDIFGGNAFLPVLFLMAGLLSGVAVLPQAHDTDIYLTALGILLTAVYICGLIFRPRRRVLGIGVDSLVVLTLYLIGLAGLVAVALG